MRLKCHTPLRQEESGYCRLQDERWTVWTLTVMCSCFQHRWFCSSRQLWTNRSDASAGKVHRRGQRCVWSFYLYFTVLIHRFCFVYFNVYWQKWFFLIKVNMCFIIVYTPYPKLDLSVLDLSLHSLFENKVKIGESMAPSSGHYRTRRLHCDEPVKCSKNENKTVLLSIN